MLPPNVTVLILGIIDPKIYAIPYVILIIILAIVALALFTKFPSLRNYRRKRSIVVYSALLLVFALLVFQAYDVGCVAFVDYRVESAVKFHPESAKQLGLTCSSRGVRSCSFYLVLKSVNASFPVQTELNYVHINDTSVKIPFTLGLFSPTKVTKYLVFEIDKDVTGFSFSILHDSWSGGCMFLSGQTSVSYIWNGTENCFMLYRSGLWIV